MSDFTRLLRLVSKWTHSSTSMAIRSLSSLDSPLHVFLCKCFIYYWYQLESRSISSSFFFFFVSSFSRFMSRASTGLLCVVLSFSHISADCCFFSQQLLQLSFAHALSRCSISFAGDLFLGTRCCRSAFDVSGFTLINARRLIDVTFASSH